jgi:Fe-S-cluster containining protein
VTLLGEDVWRLSRRLRLAPEQFVLAHPQPQPSNDGFLLQAGGPVLGLALDKQGRFRDTAACVFLLELGGGQSRCGVYPDRPVVCQGYPMSFLAGRVGQRTDALCPPDSWPAEMLPLGAWRTALQRLRMAWDVYAEVVARWNARVSGARPEREFGFSEFLAYVMNVYDRLDRLSRELGVLEEGRIRDEWPNLPRPEWGEDDLRQLRESAWWRYFERARAIIDRFYRQVPPLPYLMLSAWAPAPPMAATVTEGRVVR